MDNRGIVYIATNDLSQREVSRAREALRRTSADLPVTVLAKNYEGFTPAQSSRWLKCNIDLLTDYDSTLYMDADTRVQTDISAGFEMLESGFDMVIAPSANQEDECLWHIGEAERYYTFRLFGGTPLQLQAGIFWFVKNERTRAFFAAWRREWLLFKDQDQAAFIRALIKFPIKIWLLGRPWNGGAVIHHYCGRCRA